MHQTPASVNAFYASFVALHFWPIFDPSPPKTAEIRHFPSATAAKTVQLQLDGDKAMTSRNRAILVVWLIGARVWRRLAANRGVTANALNFIRAMSLSRIRYQAKVAYLLGLIFRCAAPRKETLRICRSSTGGRCRTLWDLCGRPFLSVL